MKRTTTIALLLVILFSCLVGCQKSNNKTFTLDEFSITLSDEYAMTPRVSFFVSYETADREAVLVARNSKNIVETVADKTDLSLIEYANLVIKTNQKGSDPKEKDGVTYYTYSTLTDGVQYTYLATVHKSENAYWLVQFVCESDRFDDKQATYFRYAKSVTFNEDYEKTPSTT